MSEMTTDQRLAQIPLFAGLSKKELAAVSALATRLDLPAGKELTKQGATGGEFLIVLEGEAEVLVDGNVVATRGPGDFFGEIALLSDRPRTATVVAKTAISVEVIGRREFKALVDVQPSIGTQLEAAMAERIEADDLA